MFDNTDTTIQIAKTEGNFDFATLGFAKRRSGQANRSLLKSYMYDWIVDDGCKIEIVGEIDIKGSIIPTPCKNFALVITLPNGTKVAAAVPTDRLKTGVISALYEIMPIKAV